MEERLISFETAKLAKSLGFDWKTYEGYNTDTEEISETWYDNIYLSDRYITYLEKEENIPAPSQSILQKWLREKHGIYVLVENNDLSNVNIAWYFYINKIGGGNILNDTIKYKTYEEALENGLIKGFIFIK